MTDISRDIVALNFSKNNITVTQYTGGDSVAPDLDGTPHKGVGSAMGAGTSNYKPRLALGGGSGGGH